MEKKTLVGYENFVRSNPKSDFFETDKFDHIEYYCQDATNISRRFSWGLGMQIVAKSDQSTGNQTYASYVIRSGNVKFMFTAPYSKSAEKPDHTMPHPGYTLDHAYAFNMKHGLAVRAVGIRVKCAREAYTVSVSKGARSAMEPAQMVDEQSGLKMVISEVELYGDVVLRYISGEYDGAGLPNYEKVDGPDMSVGIERMDHCVGNVPDLLEAVNYICGFTGFHEFAEFTAEDVGTVDSGLNSMVLANNSEMILLPINEPTHGTRRKSQIQTYLEQNGGAGLQHIALKSKDIFHTLAEMRKRSYMGGFEFMPRPSDEYYEKLPTRIGTSDLTVEQFKRIQDLGLLVDKDDQGILLQIFTKPLGDRPTIFIEIIERIGCLSELNGRLEQAAGCGGFGKGNFSELFKSIEEYEKTLQV